MSKPRAAPLRSSREPRRNRGGAVIPAAVLKRAATPPPSSPSAPPLSELPHACTVSTPPALLRQATSTQRITFHFRTISAAASQVCQSRGAPLQHSRAPSPRPNASREDYTARAVQELDEQRPSRYTQAITQGFSLCFWQRARSLSLSQFNRKSPSPYLFVPCLVAESPYLIVPSLLSDRLEVRLDARQSRCAGQSSLC